MGYDVHIYRFSSRYDKCSVDEHTPRSSSAMAVVCIQLMTVTIQLAVWMQPVAYSYTDVDFDSDVWVCLDVDHIGKVTSITLKSLGP